MPLTATLADRFLECRTASESLCAPLETEDYVVQPIVDVSPPKWHLGHTTWFFEEFILKQHQPGYREFHPDFSFVFNSYYESVGKRVVRANRGNLSRPGVKEVYAYRRYVTEALTALLEAGVDEEITSLVEIGINHEQQHQELLLTDIKYILGNNPLLPPYVKGELGANLAAQEYAAIHNEAGDGPQGTDSNTPYWLDIPRGIYPIGFQGEGFCFDNELGAHEVLLQDYSISRNLVTNGEMMAFIANGGYERFELWHAAGWDWVQEEKVEAPLYWHHIDGEWYYYSLRGLQKVDPMAPLSHISYYEAFALAGSQGLRLPTEFEWEVAAASLHWGQRWEWTESAYLPYPGYKRADGALGEYNGKFMVSQKVLRGASIATPPGHSRPTYRNFFHPQLRWQYTGLRFAR
ncbi:ergothioneine biosynthesis protein EgtB [Robiginitalea myxolifaciens]|uniref:Ergothioneine biosynthesis protein EgtB n=1 Tax=Robiginitalea myxolifaciens TaxID=400055 RepID=A0A1I6FSD7_9FLAO|nr:ergothioneine biosynthesis protein EgtB [Robiginitalea myxolifaciens]SFR32717.1 ergothioneine biosynthesis protein EgtB [Robiginitalea myxolifaciens]